MKQFVEAEEAHRLSLAFVDRSRNQRQEPNMGLTGSNLFSHGPKPGLVFGASMANLHYKNPADCSTCHLLPRTSQLRYDPYHPRSLPRARAACERARGHACGSPRCVIVFR